MIWCVPENHVVTRTALSLASFNSPKAAYASLQSRSVCPSSRTKSPRENSS